MSEAAYAKTLATMMLDDLARDTREEAAAEAARARIDDLAKSLKVVEQSLAKCMMEMSGVTREYAKLNARVEALELEEADDTEEEKPIEYELKLQRDGADRLMGVKVVQVQ